MKIEDELRMEAARKQLMSWSVEYATYLYRKNLQGFRMEKNELDDLKFCLSLCTNNSNTLKK